MSGKASKTNLGSSLEKIKLRQEAGSPSSTDLRVATGVITDIRLPGEPLLREGSGIMVQIFFDDKTLRTSRWIPLKDSYEHVLATVGNRQAITKSPHRVAFHFSSSSPESGYAELISDNKSELSYSEFMKNRSNLYINVISGLTFRSRPPG